jgi:hypothetical protein
MFNHKIENSTFFSAIHVDFILYDIYWYLLWYVMYFVNTYFS